MSDLRADDEERLLSDTAPSAQIANVAASEYDAAMLSRRSLLRAALGAAGAGTLIAGCRGDGATKSTERPLTNQEAGWLAGILLDNLDRGGARFSLSVGAPGSTDSLRLDGEVDWIGHAGRATCDGRGSEAHITEVIWGETIVIERRPRLAGTVVNGVTLPAYYTRPPDIPGRLLDQMLALLIALAGQRSDNPVLVSQEDGSAYLGRTDVGGVAADRLRFGQSSVYLLAVDDQRLLRAELQESPGAPPIAIDLSDLRPRTIQAPSIGEAIAVEQVQAAYDADRARP